jgi:AraC-like DNA-binding protein
MELGKNYPSLLSPGIIDGYWVYKCASQANIQSKIFPQGFSSIIFYFTGRKESASSLGAGSPYILVSGEQTAPGPVYYHKNDFFIVARLKSFYLHPLLKIDMESLTDKMLSLEDVNKKLYQRLMPCSSPVSLAEKLRLIDRELYLLFNNNQPRGSGMTEAISLAFSSKGTCSIEELLEAGGLSARSLERNFLKTVGIPPKAFNRVIRFNNIIHRLKSGYGCPLVETALDFGYYDQAHFYNDFKKLSGYTPSHFLSL